MNQPAAVTDIPALRFESVSRSDAGARRSVNEDRVLERPGDGLWAVADGMGGLQGGDVAAERLIEALAAVKHGRSGYACLADIHRVVGEVNAGLFAGRTAPGGAPTGTTVVALLAHEGHYACLWAGDSRGYLMRDGRLTGITRDHSVVQQLVDGGLLTEGERGLHPRAHVITRAIGVGPELVLDQRFAPIQAGDIFLLCSDGLTACLQDEEIARILGRGPSPREAADQLLACALERRAADNVSFVLVRALPPD